jgi:hypothetical protein
MIISLRFARWSNSESVNRYGDSVKLAAGRYEDQSTAEDDGPRFGSIVRASRPG